MKKTILLLMLLISNYSLLAQHIPGYDKLGASLKLLLLDTTVPSKFIVEKNGSKVLSLLLETNGPDDAAILRKMGYTVRTIMGTIATADIPLSSLYTIVNSPVVKRVELPLLLHKLADTIMRRFTTVQQVQEGMAPLNIPYRGDGTVIGIIDDGADISHPEFYDESGLRIKYLWSMDYNNGAPPQGYTYGREFTNDTLVYYARQFKAKKLGIYQMQQLFGYTFHGTAVTSLAAGNSGVAPGATIVSVSLTAFEDTLLRSDRIIDGIAYIYSIAQKEHKKCVINISLGTQDGGPHDGKTLLEKAIDNFCHQHPDILVCTSAGNNGNDWKHWGGFPIDKDSSFGFFYCTYKASLYFTVPKQYSKTLNIAIGEAKLGNLSNPNISRDSVYFQTPSLNIDSLIMADAPAVFTSYLPGGALSSYITFAAAHYNDDYDELIVTTDERTSNNSNPFDSHLYRFILKGTGLVHAWYPFLNLHPVFYFNSNPYPDDSTYHNTDNEYSTVIPTNAFTVLSSGAYNLRTCYINMFNKNVYQYERCRTTYFTSHGPTLDGRIKPDVLSPGDNVIAAHTGFDDYLNYDFMLDSSTMMFGGTSASSPITAGVAALIWEQHPDYTKDDIIRLIKSSANFDSHCQAWGDKPNNIAGWGKIDAFNAMAGVRIDNEQLCSQQDVCNVQPGPQDTTPQLTNTFLIYPNPVKNSATIYYVSNQHLQCYLFDALGRYIKYLSLPAAPGGTTMKLNMYSLAQGIYFLKVKGWEKSFTKKILVAR